MATRVGVSPASVQRIWSARGLKPHLVKTFKLSNDRHFEDSPANGTLVRPSVPENPLLPANRGRFV
jgi:hypothetical protein